MARQKLGRRIRRDSKLQLVRGFTKRIRNRKNGVDKVDNKKEQQQKSLQRKLRGSMEGRTKFV